MKRELIQNVKVTPYTSEEAIDRDGFLSAVLGVLVGTPTGDVNIFNKITLKIKGNDITL